MRDYEKIKQKIINDVVFRKEITAQSFYWFSHTYFPHYIVYPTAEFQKEIYTLLQDWSLKFVEIIAFRGSAKSTIAMLALPIWAIISRRVKFPVLTADTFPQAKLHIYNLKTELEMNRQLIEDWGPFEGKEEWTATNIVLPKYGVRITAKSTGQKTRGIRHKQYRPDLFIIDDIENLEMVRTKEQRDKTFRWFNGDVIPAGDVNTRYIIIGNLLHRDSIMSRIKGEIERGERKGVVKEYPFLDKDGKALWAEKFPTEADIQKERDKVNDMRTWQREYLLKIIPEEGQEVRDNWIRYYDRIPNELVECEGTGVDLAISKKETADYTAMVSGKLAFINGNPKIYILPNPVNERLSGFETTERAKQVSLSLGDEKGLTTLWVEDVAYQRMQIESMERVGLPVEGVKVSTDKRARLRTIATYIQNGTVLFPRRGCEDLIIQLTGFGVEAHDDLVDAFVLLVQGLMSIIATEPGIEVF
ncbi:MAG: phage terminase large subunit [Candidatus Hodarchaeales archaeon]